MWAAQQRMAKWPNLCLDMNRKSNWTFKTRMMGVGQAEGAHRHWHIMLSLECTCREAMTTYDDITWGPSLDYLMALLGRWGL